MLLDRVMAHAEHPVHTALEIGAGTGKATRLFAQQVAAVTATDPDAAMLAELRKHVPAGVRTEQAAFEELRLDETYGLVCAAASLHWIQPENRWSRMAQLVRSGGVFASFGGPLRPADPAVEEVVRTLRAPFLDSDEIPSPDGTPPEHAMQWPGTELQQSSWFTDVRQSVIERRYALSAIDYLGHLSTISAYFVLAPAQREELFRRIGRVVPDVVEMKADITLHLARRRHEP
ncbi:class I SAM-dependent methyltransferase [Streptomyces rubiginosohelvolus]|uniref:class I SAM-dependent methyltransferase n=1 Tax=Streptomyces rubiginosohelvolus TaxID=67362 RepID=UPI00369A959F|nr:class I SAM-dependent methyltransferase [Streptomyces rubiginosohelvolus]